MENGPGRFYGDALKHPLMSSPFRSTGDLLFVVVWTSVTVAAVLTGLEPGALRTVLALPLVTLFPGYALLALLFPEKPGGSVGEGGSAGAAISGVERVALSVVVSLALVPLLAFVVNYAYGLFVRPLLLTVGGATVGVALLGYVARVRLPVDRRHHVRAFGRVADVTTGFLSTAGRGARNVRPLRPTTGAHRTLNLLLVASVLVLLATAGWAAVTPPANDDPFTEFYLTTQNDSGEFVSENLPHEFSAGESRSVFVAITNKEGQRVPYTVVVTLDGNELDRFSRDVGAGRTTHVEQSVTPQQTGDRLRLSFLLYRGDVPANPSPENAYRETGLWISVSG